MFRTVLVAIDGSDHSFRALDAAIDVALRYSAQLMVLHVVPPAFLPQPGDEEGEPENLDAPTEYMHFRQKGRQLMEEATARAASEGYAAVTPEVVVGDPAEEIVARSKSQDLVVVGSRGWGAEPRLPQGSVAHKVVQLATSPCLVIK